MSDVFEIVKKAKEAKTSLAILTTNEKNELLKDIALSIENNLVSILDANKIDIDAAIKNGIKESLIDRLQLNEKRIKQMADGVRQIADLDDPIGSISNITKRPNGLKIGNMCVPLGVVAIIYEARPNVTSDAVALCLKTGNSIVLRGGKEAINSNIAIVDAIKQALLKHNLDNGCVGLITDTKRESANQLMKMHEYVDLLIPRGGASLIKNVIENSTVPTIQTGVGNCHIFVEKTADIKMAKDIIVNAKTSRPSVCNAAETLLIDEGLKTEDVLDILNTLIRCEVEIHGDEKICQMIDTAILATEDDFKYEYLDKKIAVKLVNGFNGAIEHISKYSTMHSECIITSNYQLSQKFLEIVDAAAVYVNASTRFTDGFEFGFGAEMGISTQKLHARGPMGLKALTSNKYIIYGNGQVR